MSSSTAKRSLGIAGALLAGVMFSAAPVLTAMPAHAAPNDDHGHGNDHRDDHANDHRPPPPVAHNDWHGGGYHGGGYNGGGGYHNNTGAIVGGALLGLGVGAAIGSLAAPPVVYRPAPTYYAPPPVYYGY